MNTLPPFARSFHTNAPKIAAPVGEGAFETRAERVERREKKACERAEELRAAIRGILTKGETPMTRKELWDCLPDPLRVNEARFKAVLEEGVGSEWRKEELNGPGGGFRYRPLSDGE